MLTGSVCSGTGLLDRGLVAAGHEIAWHSELDPHCCAVLERRFPGASNVGDLTALHASPPPPVDMLVGGIPCQGHSHAGKRKGASDERNLWPAVVALLEAWSSKRPAVVVVENVPGLLSSDGDTFGQILEDGVRLGYVAEWDHVPACALGGMHVRDRVFVVLRRDGRLTWDVDEQTPLFAGVGGKWPRAGRWDGGLHLREPQWPIVREPRYWQSPDAGGGGRTTKGNARPDEGGLACQVRMGWPTVRAGDAKQGPSSLAKHLESGDLMLSDVVRLGHWTTPDAGGFQQTEDVDAWQERRARLKETTSAGNGCGTPLGMQVRLGHWATPDASFEKLGYYSPDQLAERAEAGRQVTLPEQVMRLPSPPEPGAALSPDWTEALMSCPVGWTDLSCDSPTPLPGVVAPRVVAKDGASPQYEWEPPRLTTRKDQRTKRLRAVGNGVDGGAAEVVGNALRESADKR